jgi:peptide/nickel transport system permease protein
VSARVVTTQGAGAATAVEVARPEGRLLRRSLMAVPVAILGVFVLAAVLADWISPHSPYTTSLTERLLPPAWQPGGSAEHLLGTDRLGRDILSRLIFGARYSLAAGLAAVLLGGLVGAALGLIAGYYGRWVDALIMRTTDAALSMPIILIALLFAVAFGPSFANLIVVLGLVMWARFARLVRGEVLSLKERDFVALARVAGSSDARIILVHILPNVLNGLMVLGTLQVGWVLIVEAALSFLGAGIPPPTPSWGGMIADGGTNIASAWWLSLFPGIALVLVLLALNLLGDTLRDVLDPKMAAR